MISGSTFPWRLPCLVVSAPLLYCRFNTRFASIFTRQLCDLTLEIAELSFVICAVRTLGEYGWHGTALHALFGKLKLTMCRIEDVHERIPLQLGRFVVLLLHRGNLRSLML